ncbi:MAG: hypothetical protein HKP61_03290 [Dactylosporangium sp.]|nr:hypothetical protein [Dactylosporangium sp.]NNJ59978.1 hypothetical protein [Dactylosporangium sp.]
MGFTRRTAQAGFTAMILVVTLTTATVRQGHPAFPGSTLLVFSVLAWLPLLLRTRWPLVALVGVVAIECRHLAVLPFIDAHPTAQVAMGAYQPVPLATMAAAWTVASRRPWPVAWAAGGTSAAALLITSHSPSSPRTW